MNCKSDVLGLPSSHRFTLSDNYEDNYKLFFSLCSDDAVLAAIGPVSSLPQWLVLWSNIRTTPPPAEGCEYLASYSYRLVTVSHYLHYSTSCQDLLTTTVLERS